MTSIRFFAGAAVCVLAMGASAFEIARNVKVTGAGEDQTHWKSEPVELEPETCYAFSCRIKYDGGVGVAVVGPDSAHMYLKPSRDGRSLVNVFRTPAAKKGARTVKERFELGQWHMKGPVLFETADVVKVRPVYVEKDGLTLGWGERADGHLYSLDMPFRSASKNHFRVETELANVSATGKGWQLARRGSVTLRHELAGRNLKAARFAALVTACSTNTVLAFDASADGGRTWTELATCATVTCVRASIPAALLPARELRVRVRGVSSAVWACVGRYAFEAEFDGAPAFAFGSTRYLDEAGRTLVALEPKSYLAEITGETLVRDGELALWRESSGRKVFRGRPLPAARAETFRLAAARNEAEAAQLVLTPARPFADVRVSATPLVKKNGLFGLGKADVLAAESVYVGRVGYQTIDFTMDTMGACGRWPDPIFDQDAAPLPVPAGENQPFWIRVKPPKGTPAGVYRGELVVAARTAAGAAFERRVPLAVEVYDFDFPDETTCQTAFGVNFYKFVFPYQRVKTPADRAVVVDKYFRVLADHHISPYQPVPLAPAASWHVQWTKTEDPAAAEPIFDWTKWDAAMEEAFAKYHFNTFRIAIQGLGSSDVSQSRPAKFCGRSYDDPLYQTRIAKYLKGVQDHLEEKGWLDKAYVYVFDEPLKSQVPLVAQGLGTVAKYAPKLRRMLTTEPQEGLMDGCVNLWNPLTYVNWEDEKAREARAKKHDFWWYITFSSEEPLVNEHVEHAGVDMRLWGWQTWNADVHGVLIWELVYWNAVNTFTDKARPQNPYEDAMCWTRIWHPWNSGEGRYLYPPKACFDGGTQPVLEGPVDSIRFEMLREGLEDYEYFVLLRKRDPGSALLKVPETVQRHDRDYSFDPLAMETHREKLARAIVASPERPASGR